MLIIKVLTSLALLGSVSWFFYAPDFEPAIAITTSLTAFIAAWMTGKRKERGTNQSQAVGDNAVGIQAGGNVAAGDIGIKRDSTDVE
ncbi:MAG: hypothetical protein MI862_14980 [Desulfobacterales bacterium]|nr:hypothetical protein [Desulfobacterales bacterium]